MQSVTQNQALLQELDEAAESSRASQRASQASILAPEAGLAKHVDLTSMENNYGKITCGK